MDAKASKDFLVAQAAEQASLEHVPLSDLEKRMMYFVENDPSSCPDPLELNDEFEAQYETSEYEIKIGRLLHHAFDRLKAEDPQKLAIWKECIEELSHGDHYLPVLWDAKPSNEHSMRDF